MALRDTPQTAADIPRPGDDSRMTAKRRVRSKPSISTSPDQSRPSRETATTGGRSVSARLSPVELEALPELVVVEEVGVRSPLDPPRVIPAPGSTPAVVRVVLELLGWRVFVGVLRGDDDFDGFEALGVLAAIVTGWLVLDPLMAGVVALNILWSGWKVMASSVSGLLDEAVPEKTLVTIRDIISDKASGALEAHDLRTRHAGAVTFIDFHLVVDGQTTVEQAHDICDRVERALHQRLPDAQITIHVEPDHKAKHSGVLVI